MGSSVSYLRWGQILAFALGCAACGGGRMVAKDGNPTASTPKCRKNVLPAFPWPAPTPSARMALPSGLLTRARQGRNPVLKDAADALDRLMVSAGYSQRAYFQLRDQGQIVGFALVTRMERIHEDGRPFPAEQRFIPAGAPDQFDVLSFLKSLFVAPVGYYRVIALTVSRRVVEVGGSPLTEAGAERLLRHGGSRLAGCVARYPLTDDYNVDALVYEFRHAPEETEAPDKAVMQLTPGKLDPGLHLRKAGILAGR